MKRRFILVFLLIVAKTYAQQDTVILSHRVGTVIDAQEREYFGLFPDVDAFSSAVITAGQSNSEKPSFLISSSEEPYTHRLQTDTATLMLLRHYLKHYEYDQLMYKQYSTRYTRKRDIILERDGCIERYEAGDLFTVSARYSSGGGAIDTATGLVLYCDNTVIMVARPGDTTLIADPVIIPVNNLISIQYYDGNAFWRGFRVWFFAGYIPSALLVSVYLSNDKYFRARDLMPVFVYATIPGALIGILGGLVNYLLRYNNERDEFDVPDEMEDVIQLLRKRQFFNRGLPPDLKRWK